MAEQAGLFDLDEHYAGLIASGDPLDGLLRVVDFEILHEALGRAPKRSERRHGRHPSLDAAMMFKLLVSLRSEQHGNPYGRYGSPYSSDSINNPYGAGSPYRHDSPNNLYGQGLRIDLTPVPHPVGSRVRR